METTRQLQNHRRRHHPVSPPSFLKPELLRSLSSSSSPSPSRSRPTFSSSMSAFLRRYKAKSCPSDSLLSPSAALPPLFEGPTPSPGPDPIRTSTSSASALGQWVKERLARSPSHNSKSSCDLRLMLGVLASPLAPIPVASSGHLPLISVKDTPIESSSAQYILQQYTAASGGLKLQNSVQNAYAQGKLKLMSMEFDSSMRVVKSRSTTQTGGFVLWQMNPDMWYLELTAGDVKVQAGCNAKLVWRYTPWVGTQAAKGPIRPLRRALQGIDPRTTASLFSDARCIGEKKINGENCFVLKLSADTEALKARSEGPMEVMRHNLLGYFSQKTGLLVSVEDSQLTRRQPADGDSVFWETTINSYLEDYRPVEGIMIAHSGRSVATLFTFGETAMNHMKTRMEEFWTIDEIAFDVPGLSADCFIPPADLKSEPISNENLELVDDSEGRRIRENAIALDHGVSRINL